VLVLSPNWLASVDCNAELDLALEAKKRSVPLLRRDLDPAHVREEVARVNWLSFRDADDSTSRFDGSPRRSRPISRGSTCTRAS